MKINPMVVYIRLEEKKIMAKLYTNGSLKQVSLFMKILFYIVYQHVAGSALEGHGIKVIGWSLKWGQIGYMLIHGIKDWGSSFIYNSSGRK